MSIAVDLEDIAEDGALTAEAIEDFIYDNGIPRATVYAAAAANPELRFAREHDVAFVCCSGGCQQWGALERLEQLLRVRDDRRDEGAPAFDVHARACLDKCEDAPVVEVITPDGTATIAVADEAKLAAAVAQAVE